MTLFNPRKAGFAVGSHGNQRQTASNDNPTFLRYHTELYSVYNNGLNPLIYLQKHLNVFFARSCQSRQLRPLESENFTGECSIVHLGTGPQLLRLTDLAVADTTSPVKFPALPDQTGNMSLDRRTIRA
jgi:hypothetical protein